MSDEHDAFTFLGVEYESVTSPLSGGDSFVYHAGRPFTVF